MKVDTLIKILLVFAVILYILALIFIPDYSHAALTTPDEVWNKIDTVIFLDSL